MGAADRPTCERLLEGARDSGDALTRAFGGVLSRFPIRGLAARDLQALHVRYFPGVRGGLARCFEPPAGGDGCPALRADEFDDLVALLLEHRASDAEETRWLAHAVATACLGDNHLWQDMGLSGREAISLLLRSHFTALHEKNTGNMKWKKFFYKQLCARAEVNLCKAPSCRVCDDYPKCFGPEEGATAARQP